MTEQRSIRSFPALDLEVRAGGDGRTLYGIAAPFDSPADIVDWQGEYRETIKRGAFKRTIGERGPHRVKLLAQHAAAEMPIGHATLLREDTAGLYGEFRVSKTPRGDEALELVRDGTIDGLSIGFRVVRDEWSTRRDERTLIEVRLHEVSVVPQPAYADAVILGARSGAGKPPNSSLEVARLRLEHLSRKVVTAHG